MAESADALASGASPRKGVWVQVPLSAPHKKSTNPRATKENPLVARGFVDCNVYNQIYLLSYLTTFIYDFTNLCNTKTHPHIPPKTSKPPQKRPIQLRLQNLNRRHQLINHREHFFPALPPNGSQKFTVSIVIYR